MAGIQESGINTHKSGVKIRRKPTPKIVHFWGSPSMPKIRQQIRNSTSFLGLDDLWNRWPNWYSVHSWRFWMPCKDNWTSRSLQGRNAYFLLPCGRNWFDMIENWQLGNAMIGPLSVFVAQGSLLAKFLGCSMAANRTWSCNTLLRGSSFLDEQRAANQTVGYEGLLSVPRLQDTRWCPIVS